MSLHPMYIPPADAPVAPTCAWKAEGGPCSTQVTTGKRVDFHWEWSPVCAHHNRVLSELFEAEGL